MNQYIERAKHGDIIATGAIIEYLRPRLAKMAAYYARICGEDADDLLQEAWIGLLEALPGIDLHIGSPEQHLIQRARWRMLDSIKHARLRRCTPLDDSLAESIPQPAVDDAAQAIYISEFATQLTETQRAVFDCLIDGLTWREAGQVLGCTSANVAYHVRQIRRQYEEWCR